MYHITVFHDTFRVQEKVVDGGVPTTGAHSGSIWKRRWAYLLLPSLLLGLGLQYRRHHQRVETLLQHPFWSHTLSHEQKIRLLSTWTDGQLSDVIKGVLSELEGERFKPILQSITGGGALTLQIEPHGTDAASVRMAGDAKSGLSTVFGPDMQLGLRFTPARSPASLSSTGSALSIPWKTLCEGGRTELLVNVPLALGFEFLVSSDVAVPIESIQASRYCRHL